MRARGRARALLVCGHVCRCIGHLRRPPPLRRRRRHFAAAHPRRALCPRPPAHRQTTTARGCPDELLILILIVIIIIIIIKIKIMGLIGDANAAMSSRPPPQGRQGGSSYRVSAGRSAPGLLVRVVGPRPSRPGFSAGRRPLLWACELCARRRRRLCAAARRHFAAAVRTLGERACWCIGRRR